MINVDAVVDSTKSMLDERYSGFAFVGFIAGCDTPVTIIDNDRSEIKRLALIAKLQEAEMKLCEAAQEE